MKKALWLGLVWLCCPLELWAFDGNQALQHIQTQLDFGPRYPTSPGHQKTRQWLIRRLGPLADRVEKDRWDHEDAHKKVYALENLVFRFQPQRKQRLILGAHYDSRRFADKDPADPFAALAGANDSASGVAVLVELAPQLAALIKGKEWGLDLVFFDAEEGELDPKARPWKPIGSIHFASQLSRFYPELKPQLAIVVDMVCDKDLQLKFERFSLDSVPKQVWRMWELGAQQSDGFIAEYGYAIYDDHYPLIQAGVPALLLIDYDYPAWHTQADQIDQCSAKSLQAVGDTLLQFLKTY
ncbi:MAG: M28 family peptidase [bacterium]|nr:M28 family peptidase [bacterium]